MNTDIRKIHKIVWESIAHLSGREEIEHQGIRCVAIPAHSHYIALQKLRAARDILSGLVSEDERSEWESVLPFDYYAGLHGAGLGPGPGQKPRATKRRQKGQ